jgi:protease IV
MSDNLAALIYLKSKVHKWKNIAVLFAIFSLILVIKFILGGSLSEKPFGADYIANIKIEGVIFEDDFRSKALQEIAKEDSVKAVIVNIDSPGGGIVGSEILFEDLRAIAERKPMVVVMGSVAASGGYMAALASNHIIAHNGTLTGSIGVLMQAQEFTELAKKVGVKFNTYKSGPLKASPSPFEKTNPLIDNVVQDSVLDSYHFFTDLVLERRGAKLNKRFANIIFDGRIFTGRQALKAGLIDQIGGKAQALSYLEANKVNVKKLPLYEIEIIKKDDKFLDKFTSLIQLFDGIKTTNSSHQIMAIMK